MARWLALLLLAQPVPLPKGEQGIGLDDLAYSPSQHALLVPAALTGKLDLVDVDSRAVTSVDGFDTTPSPAGRHGGGPTSVAEDGKYLFVTDRSAKRLDVVENGAIVAWAPLAAGPDYVRWVVATGEVWVTEPHAQQIEVFALKLHESTVRAQGGGQLTRRGLGAPEVGETGPPQLVSQALIAVPGGPESLVVEDRPSGRAFSNEEKPGRTVAIDLAARKIVATWPSGCAQANGLALDEAHGHLFVGCNEGKAMVLDTRTGKLLGSVATGAGVDAIDYAPKLGHLYVPGSKSATLTVISVGGDGRLAVLGTVPTVERAHCVAADDRAHVWVCDPEHGRLLEISDGFSTR